ncbi:MAG: Gfo/Idh/MocA family oxidoreductase, partial [Candidatus Latescibacteria bacterium]|nr:Gfo/Idh/MocA family oxidoreductase [Candidatus Latescibacterota bacterium]
PAIANADEAELVAFADPNRERLEAQMKQYGKPGYASFEEMLAEEELDAVAIPTHPDIKLDQCRIAAEHGLHVFCEKPLTDDEAQAEALVRLMDEKGLFVGISFVYRGKKIVQRMMELTAEGAIGHLKAVHLQNLWDYHGLRDAAQRGDRRRRALANLGTLDCGVHHLDLARYMSGGDFKKIQALGDIIEPENTFPDHIVVQARMDNGVIVTIDESAVYGYTAKERPLYAQSYCMIGEGGVLSANLGDWGNTSELYVISGEEQWREQVVADKAWDETYHQFFQTILGRRPDRAFIASGRDGLINMQVAREIIAQCEAGMHD